MPLDLSTLSAALPPNAGLFLARMARLGAAPAPPPIAAEEAPAGQAAWTTLTPAMLRTALLEMGVTASAENIQIAEAFTQLGLPLTAATLKAATVGLASAPGASPLAFALAKSLDLPTTPDILRALATVTGGIPAKRAMPIEITEWLGLAIHGEDDSETLAGRLHLLVNQRAQSTEQRLRAAGEDNAANVHDTRSLLLRLAQTAGDRQIRAGADTLAAHIEGQQLVNLAAQRSQSDDSQTAFYFAMPLLLPGEQTMLELSVQRREDEREDDWEESTPAGWRTTIRLATTRLGRIEATLTGTALGSLICRLGAEQPATMRLLQRSHEKLTASLAAAGWPHPEVICQPKTDWPPLWHGGQALTSPRACMDWKA